MFGVLAWTHQPPSPPGLDRTDVALFGRPPGQPPSPRHCRRQADAKRLHDGRAPDAVPVPEPHTLRMTNPAPALLRFRLLILLAFGLGLGAIVGAWGFQVIGGYVPCKLCLQERVFYYVGLPPLLLALAIAKASPRLARLLALLGGLTFLAGTGLGVYHVGAEWGFWLGPADCGGGTAPVTNAADLLAQMKSTRLVSCSEASIDLFGLSFAGWNAVVSAVVAVLSLAAALGRRPA